MVCLGHTERFSQYTSLCTCCSKKPSTNDRSHLSAIIWLTAAKWMQAGRWPEMLSGQLDRHQEPRHHISSVMARCCQVMVLQLSDECNLLGCVDAPFGAEQEMYCWKIVMCLLGNECHTSQGWCYSFADQSRLSARCCTALNCYFFAEQSISSGGEVADIARKGVFLHMWNVPITSLPCHSNPVFQLMPWGLLVINSFQLMILFQLQRLHKDYKPLSQYILVSQCEMSVPLFNDDLIFILN